MPPSGRATRSRAGVFCPPGRCDPPRATVLSSDLARGRASHTGDLMAPSRFRFVCALAALALAACSSDGEPAASVGPPGSPEVEVLPPSLTGSLAARLETM